MQLEVREDRDWHVVDIVGVVDVQTAPQLRETLQSVQFGRGSHLLVDLDRVELLDSFGLGVLVDAQKRARAHGGEVALVITRERLRRVLEGAGLEGAFRVVGSADEVHDA